MTWSKGSVCGRYYRIQCDKCKHFLRNLYMSVYDANLDESGLHTSKSKGKTDWCPRCFNEYSQEQIHSDEELERMEVLWAVTNPFAGRLWIATDTQKVPPKVLIPPVPKPVSVTAVMEALARRPAYEPQPVVGPNVEPKPSKPGVPPAPNKAAVPPFAKSGWLVDVPQPPGLSLSDSGRPPVPSSASASSRSGSAPTPTRRHKELKIRELLLLVSSLQQDLDALRDKIRDL
jgi:hypothetical protein